MGTRKSYDVRQLPQVMHTNKEKYNSLERTYHAVFGKIFPFQTGNKWEPNVGIDCRQDTEEVIMLMFAQLGNRVENLP